MRSQALTRAGSSCAAMSARHAPPRAAATVATTPSPHQQHDPHIAPHIIIKTKSSLQGRPTRRLGRPSSPKSVVAVMPSAVAETLSQASMPAGMFPVSGPWGVWSALVVAGAFGLWSERTRLGKELSGALVATLAGMFMANVGMLPASAPELGVVYKFVLPLAIPMLLFSANLRRIVGETGRLLPAFLLGSLTTVAGSAIAFLIMPLGRFLGEDGWKVASALTARHIGGAVNYMAVTDSLGVSPSVFGAGLAADDLILTLYFTTIYALAKSIPPDAPPTQPPPVASTASDSSNSNSSSSSSKTCLNANNQSAAPAPPSGSDMDPVQASEPGGTGQHPGGSDPAETSGLSGSAEGSPAGGHTGVVLKPIQVREGLLSLALSCLICHAGFTISRSLGVPGQFITVITALTVVAATIAPGPLGPLVSSAQGLAQILMQVFYATIGASANVALVIKTAPILFLFSFVALAGHLGLLLAAGAALGFTRRDLLLASNANIGGPSTVAGMAAAKGWTSSLVPSILTSTLGYALGTFAGMALGQLLFKRWL